MDIFFEDPTEVPLPPNEVRIRKMTAEPWPDGRRVKVYLEVDPFQKRPNADLRIIDPAAQEVATASIIQTMVRKMEVNLHLRGVPAEGEYTLKARLYYSSTPEDPPAGEDERPEAPEPEDEVVDSAELTFQLPRPESGNS